MILPSSGPDPRAFRQRLLAREPLIGSFLKFPGPQATEIFGSIGYDFVVLDEEHAPWTREQLGMGCLAGRAFGIATLVRVARPDAASILSVLDDGATGIMVPHVSTVEAAENVAAWARYIGGKRGAGVGRAGDYGGAIGPGGPEEYYAKADEGATVVAMIEDVEAIDNIDAIADVPGIDAFFLGRADLALSLGNVNGANPALDDALATVAKAVVSRGKTLSAVTPDLASDDAKRLTELGVTCMMVGSDQGFMKLGAQNQLERFGEFVRHAEIAILRS